MSKLQLLLACWGLGLFCAWFVYQAFTTGTVWVKRNTFRSPWYYKVSREESPFTYWVNTATLILFTVASFVAPIFLHPK